MRGICKDCGDETVLLLNTWLCNTCDPPKALYVDDPREEFDDEKTPTMDLDWKLVLPDDVFDDDTATTVYPTTLPITHCIRCHSAGFAGSMCYACNLFRP